MASGDICDNTSSDDLNWTGKCRWTENSKVYTRRNKKATRTTNKDDTATADTLPAEKPSATATTAAEDPSAAAAPAATEVSSATAATSAAAEASSASTSPPATSENNTAAGEGGVDVVIVASPQALEAKRLSTNPTKSDEPQNFKRTSPPNEVELTSGEGVENLRKSVPSPDLPNGGEVVEARHKLKITFPTRVSNAIRTRGERLQSSGDLLLPPPENNNLPNGVEVLEDSSFPQSQVSRGDGPVNVNGVVKLLAISRVDERVRLNIAKATPKNEIQELSKQLMGELDVVRRVVKHLEAKEHQIASSYNTRISSSNLSDGSNYVSADGGNICGEILAQHQNGRSDLLDRRSFMRVNEEGDLVERRETRPTLARVHSDIGAARNLDPRPYNRQLSVVVMENSYGTGDIVEKEKRTPKANKFYRNSEFLLGKDRLPPESNKRLKTNSGRKHNGEIGNQFGFGFGFGFDKGKNQTFKSCSSLLQRLMKHKHGWVFNAPVNVEALKCVDYYDTIKQPMDFGTIKTKLSQKSYKSPTEFAEDVRLVFRNAMTYNPKGHDVHTMAQQLSEIFEERWTVIETEYNAYCKYQMLQQDSGLLTPTSRKAPPQAHFGPSSPPVSSFNPFHGVVPAAVQDPGLYVDAAPQMRSMDGPETMTTPMAVTPRIQRPHVGRRPVPRKPKASDPNKRDMTYEEKQRLSTNLQSIPPEKLDAILQIMKRGSTALSQHDDEIEVDIDSVDAQTLWELDRFVANYKKNLSKKKRKAELALQARSVSNLTAVPMITIPAVAETRIGSESAFDAGTAPPVVERERQGYNASSSSSSSTDSGSSSTDSDSDSSSADGSDAGNLPGT